MQYADPISFSTRIDSHSLCIVELIWVIFLLEEGRFFFPFPNSLIFLSVLWKLFRVLHWDSLSQRLFGQSFATCWWWLDIYVYVHLYIAILLNGGRIPKTCNILNFRTLEWFISTRKNGSVLFQWPCLVHGWLFVLWHCLLFVSRYQWEAWEGKKNAAGKTCTLESYSE